MTTDSKDPLQDSRAVLVLREFSKDLISKTSMEEILWSITENAIGRLGFEDCVVYLVDEDRKFLKQKAAYGPKSSGSREIASEIRIPMGMGIVGSVAETGAAEIVEDCTSDPRYIPDDAFRMSELAVPIIREDLVIGVIDSEHSDVGFFTQDHLDVLETIAYITSIRLGQIELKDAVVHDRDELQSEVEKRSLELQESIREVQAKNNQLKASLEEKQESLRDLNHQIKNQMQMAHSLMNIQAQSSNSDEVRASLLLAQCRIRCIALLYQNASGKTVDPCKYLHDLHDELISTFLVEKNIELNIEADKALIPTDKAVQLGFILSDLFAGSIAVLENIDIPRSSIDLKFDSECRLHIESNWWDFKELAEMTEVFIAQFGAERVDSDSGLTLICK